MRIFSWLASKIRWMRYKANFSFGETFLADVSAPCFSRGAFYTVGMAVNHGEFVEKIWNA